MDSQRRAAVARCGSNLSPRPFFVGAVVCEVAVGLSVLHGSSRDPRWMQWVVFGGCVIGVSASAVNFRLGRIVC